MRVQSLYAGSPAETAGFQIGDKILAINGRSVENLSDDQVRR